MESYIDDGGAVKQGSRREGKFALYIGGQFSYSFLSGHD